MTARIVLFPPAGGRPDGYYRTFALPSEFVCPAHLRGLLERLWAQQEDGDVDVAAACAQVCDALWPAADDGEGYRRLLWLGLALGLAMSPEADDRMPGPALIDVLHTFPPPWPRTLSWSRFVLEAVRDYLEGGARPSDGAVYVATTQGPLGARPAKDVAAGYRALLGILVRPGEERTWMVELCRRCFEGDAVVSEPAARKELLRWWLVCAIPHAWHGRLPSRVYTRLWPWPPAPRATPDQVRLEYGPDFGPEDPRGYHVLHLDRGGTFHYEGTELGETKTASGSVTPERFDEVAETLRRAEFPATPFAWDETILPDSKWLRVSTSSLDGQDGLLLTWPEAHTSRHYATLLDQAQRWARALYDERPTTLAKDGFTVEQQAHGRLPVQRAADGAPSYTVHILGGAPLEGPVGNVDVQVDFADGRRFWATFFTLDNLQWLFDKNRRTGENAGGLYLWSVSMIIVADLEDDTITRTIEDLLANGGFEQAFSDIGPQRRA